MADRLLDSGLDPAEMLDGLGLLPAGTSRADWRRLAKSWQDQPRAPAGQSNGGQWIDEDTGGGATMSESSRSNSGIVLASDRIRASMPPPPPEVVRQKVAAVAAAYEGWTDWDYDRWNLPYRPGTNKCNLFVADVLERAGIPVPNMNGAIFGVPFYPPLAGQWADPGVEIPGWIVLDREVEPGPGDIVAEKISYRDASGHVGIVVYTEDGKKLESISVSNRVRPETVLRSDFGFRDDAVSVFRRYVGPGRSL